MRYCHNCDVRTDNREGSPSRLKRHKLRHLVHWHKLKCYESESRQAVQLRYVADISIPPTYRYSESINTSTSTSWKCQYFSVRVSKARRCSFSALIVRKYRPSKNIFRVEDITMFSIRRSELAMSIPDVRLYLKLPRYSGIRAFYFFLSLYVYSLHKSN